MNIVTVVFFIIFSTIAGGICVYWIKPDMRNTMLALLSYGYAFASAMMALQLYVYTRINISWNIESLLLPWVSILLIFGYIQRQNMHRFTFRKPNMTLISKVLLVLILLCIGYVFFESILRPVSVWDGWATWLARSKMFYIDMTIKPEALHYDRTDYPLLVSLWGTAVYIILGKVDDTAVLVCFFAYYLFLAIGFYAALRKHYSVQYALFFSFLFVTIQTFIRQGGRLEAGQADLALGYFIFIDYTLCLTYLKDKKTSSLVLLSLFLSYTCLIKYDGIPAVIVLWVSTFAWMYRKKMYRHMLISFSWMLIPIDWTMYLVLHHVGHSYASAHQFVFSLKNALNTLFEQIKEFIHISSWNMLWLVYGYCLIFFRRVNRGDVFLAHILIFSQLAVYTFLYLTTAGNSPESSFERLLVHIAPLALYAIARSIPYGTMSL